MAGITIGEAKEQDEFSWDEFSHVTLRDRHSDIAMEVLQQGLKSAQEAGAKKVEIVVRTGGAPLTESGTILEVNNYYIILEGAGSQSLIPMKEILFFRSFS